MHALSINLSDELAEESQKAALQLGITRTEFIRQAILHELQNFRKQKEQKALAKGFVLMEEHPEYLAEIKELDENLNTPLPEEEDEWWKKKS